MKYNCLKTNCFVRNEFSIVPFREVDLISIMEWRNLQLDVLRQKTPLTPENQKNYYLNSIFPTFFQECPKQVLFSFLKDGICIGYGGLTNIDWESKRVELSFLLNPVFTKNDNIYIDFFSIYIALIKMVVFEDLAFNRIFTETYNIRDLHISVLEKNGFICEGKMKEHISINGVFVDSLIHGFLKSYY